MSKVEQVCAAEDVLQWEDSRLIDFLGKCPREGDRVLDISEVKGVDELSTTQLKQLSQKLSAAYVKLGTRPLDPDDLTARLAKVPAPVGSRDFDRENEERARRLSNKPPSPPNKTDFERFCFDELTETGGRPAWPLLMLTDSTPNGERKRQIAMWVSEEDIADNDDDPPRVLSHQLEDWNEFQHKWQWINRGMHTGQEGSDEHVAWCKRRDHFYGRVHNPWLEWAKYLWNCEQEHPDIEGHIGQGLDDYALAVQTRLIEHKFHEPFQLAQNPREQDIWTTWVEYLCYLYYWQDHYAGIMARMEDEYAEAWQVFETSLQRLKASGPFHLLENWPLGTDPLVVEIANLSNELDCNVFANDTFVQATKEYRRNEKLWRKQKKRAAWAREQIAAIATEQEKKAADERAAGGDGGGAGGAGAGSPPDDKRKENGKRNRSGQGDEARSVSKKARKGAQE